MGRRNRRGRVAGKKAMCFRQGRATGKKEKMFPAGSGDRQECDDVSARSSVYFGKVEKEKGDLAEVIGLWRQSEGLLPGKVPHIKTDLAGNGASSAMRESQQTLPGMEHHRQ